jgi:sec-independent protein translocase protein TatA
MGISITQLVIIFAIVVLLFGTKKLRNLGGDLGGAIKGFRSAVKDGEKGNKITEDEGETLDGEVTSKKEQDV